MNDIVSTLKALNLHGMASAWPQVLGTARLKTLDHEAVLHQLLKAEAAQREVRSMAYQMRVARFPSHRDLAGFDFAQASVDEGLVRELNQLKFLDCAGVGKSSRKARSVGVAADVRGSGDSGRDGLPAVQPVRRCAVVSSAVQAV